MLDLSTCLKYYKREEIQEQLVLNSANREMGTRYLDSHFGKRPDTLQNKADILELAKQGVSSFHISEEHWKNPLLLSPSLKKRELDSMRTGWDLIIDIDCPDWELSKKIAFVIIKILKKHGISSISCKFSGNKGFHIGVPYKAFPKSVQGKSVRLLFPEKVKKIMEYIAYYAKIHYSNEILEGINLKNLSLKLGIKESELLNESCSNCHSIRKSSIKKNHYICSKCNTKTESDILESYISCPKCNSLVKNSQNNSNTCPYCKKDASIKKEINLHLVLGLDQVLISSRHLYRMPYSLHESSGLASIPINPFSVLAFQKTQANPNNVKTTYSFLDDSGTVEGEASDLILRALDFKLDINDEGSFKSLSTQDYRTSSDVDDIQEKIPLELFPPSILNILKGLKDGRKRALFVLVNFLTCVGWDYPDIEVLLHQWNEKNQEQLREREIKSKLTYHKAQKKKILPPNYSNKVYYMDLGVLSEEEASGRIKNPVSYAKRRAYFMNNKKQSKPKQKAKKSDKTDFNPENK
ncbi:MAG: hypothetical protein ACMXX5_02150 [Candidatus Woesearchaeota archaeon]